MGSSMEKEFQSRPFEAGARSYIITEENKSHHPDIIFNRNPVKKALTKNFGYVS